MAARATSTPTTRPKVRLVSASNTVGPDQFRQVMIPPPTAVSSDRTEPATSVLRHAGGGSSWAQPNQEEAKKPKIAAVAAASRRNSAVVEGLSSPGDAHQPYHDASSRARNHGRAHGR
jgi:hypothetical protein